MKITSRPIDNADEIDKSRDVIGINKWARSSRTISFIMLVLGWFTIPVEVFLRRDFGQRWFTIISFYTGLFLLIIFAVFQYLLHQLWEAVQNFVYELMDAINPFFTWPEPSFTDQIMDKSMLFFLTLYMLIGFYHLFKIKWRNHTNAALHSFDDGTSRLEWAAEFLMKIVNSLAIPLMWLYMRLIPKAQRTGMQIPSLINDKTAFANTIVEPLVLFLLGYYLFHGIASIWLYISSVALLIHANWREMAKMNKILDFRDSVIEAKVMVHLKDTMSQDNKHLIQHAAETIKKSPEVMPQIAEQYPDLMSIIEEMNSGRS